MPPVRSLASKCCAYIIAVIFLLSEIILIYSYYTKKKLVYIIAVIFLLSEIMFIYSYYAKKKLVYITITAPFS